MTNNMIVFIHANHLGTHEQKFSNEGKETSKTVGTFHQPKSEDNSPIRVTLPEGTKLDQYAPYVLECDLTEWSMKTKDGSYRNGITIKARKVTKETKVA